MGHVKVDIDASNRKYSVKYALNDAAGVKALLRDRHRISSARFRGDTDASCILVDLHSAIYNAGLTERQTEAIALVYGFDLTQEQAATVMGIARPTLIETLEAAASKIAAVYRKWEYEDVTVQYTQDIEEEAHAA